MSLSSDLNKHIYVGNGVTKTFDYEFDVLTEDDLHIYLTDTINGTETEITSNYSVSPSEGTFPSSNGTVTYPSIGTAISNDYHLTVIRTLEVLQPTVYPNNTSLKPKVVERSFDRITMIAQQQQEKLSRALMLSVSTDSDVSTELPPPIPNRAIGWDELGENLTNIDPGTFPLSDYTATAKLADIITKSPWVDPRAFGADMTGLTDSTSAVQNTLNTLNPILIPKGRCKVSTFDSHLGQFYKQQGTVYKETATYRQVLKSDGEDNQIVFGIEYLSAWHKRLITNPPAIVNKIVFTGDSTTYGVGITNLNYLIHSLILRALQERGINNCATVNRGQSGKTTFQWVEGGYLTGDLAENPNLLVIRWGGNDPGLTTDNNVAPSGTAGDATRNKASDYIGYLRSGLTTIRATRPLNDLSIILMMPSSFSDTSTRRDQVWMEEIRPMVKQAARDFQCCFFDTYAIARDAINGGDWMDSSGDADYHVHPQEVGNLWFADKLADLIIPKQLQYMVGTNRFTNMPAYLESSITPATALGAYHKGLAIRRAVIGNGWPIDGTVYTFHSDDNTAFQFLTPYLTVNDGQLYFRIGCDSGAAGAVVNWGDFIQIGRGGEAPSPIPITLENSWSNFDTTHASAEYYKSNGTVFLKGLIKGGTITVGTAIATLPLGYRPSKDEFMPVSSQGGYASILIQPDGQVKIHVCPNNVFVSLSGISFLAG